MTRTFIETLKKTGTQPEMHKLYNCQQCYRKNLEPEFVAFVTHGEAYCKACTKEN